ncbi:hypothetical protein SAMN05421505_16113 [Sinosporangium album]|uniref:Fibronectin type-III domain-containing protein n=1 Tax=Sinosporangium album TaxID=504805 RepID=A0A1G8L4M8_9ACTN|nr:fibronectin type III domain-containing protein [Sinosporangium album]SDI50629.1 hypothetical protein SAMN05421505_16113 [Sinosporangium album]
MTTYDLRLVAYAPNGSRSGMLPHPLSIDTGFPLNDVPSLTLAYSAHAVGAARLAGPCEVAVEYSTGAAWVEPPNGRFLRIKRAGDPTDETGARSYTLPGYSWMLCKLIMYAGPVVVDGKRPFSAVSAGAMLRTLIDEGHARGALPGLAVDFTTTHDSAGQPWAHALTLALEPGQEALALLINLSEQGVIDWQMQGRTLRVFNEGTTLAPDLAGGLSPVALRLGRDVVDAPDEATLEELASAILIEGEEGLSLEVTNPSATAPWGRWETHQQQGGVSDTGTATLLGQAALERTSRERVQITRSITPYAARHLPWAHYSPGAYVLAPGDGGQLQRLRIRQITLTRNQDGIVGGNLILNDRFLEADIRAARRAAGILGGGVASGGSGVDPAPEAGGRVPAAPAGLIVAPLAYVDEHGYARGQVTATWSPVAADVNGVAINVDGYELYGRIDSVGEVWRQLTATDGGDTTATYSPLPVDIHYAFKVRAVSQGVKGTFSAPQAVLIPDDVTPPPVPTAPQLATRLSIISVYWDGQGVGAVPMPADFEQVRVWMSTAGIGGPFTEVGTLRAAGALLVADQPYGANRTFRLTSVDRRGNESTPSSAAAIATQPLVDTDIIGQIISGANIVNGSLNAADKVIANTITGGLIQALAIDTGHLKANAVTADKVTAGSITGVKLSGDAIDGKTITGAFIRTAAAGRRLEFAPPGAAYPEMRFIPADAGSNYTRLRTRDDQFAGEATFEVTSGTNSTATAASQTTIAAGYMQMQVRDAALVDPNGGLMELAEGYALYGYFRTAADEQYFWFDGSGRTRHVGKWWDYTALGPTAGIMAGSIVFSASGAAPNTRIVSYGATMSGNMGPVCVIRRGLGSPSTHNPSGSWYVTESLPTGFRINTSFPDGYAVYWWAHRH